MRAFLWPNENGLSARHDILEAAVTHHPLAPLRHNETHRFVGPRRLEKRPAFDQYWRRLSARPAALRAKEIDDALAAEKAQPSAAPEPT